MKAVKVLHVLGPLNKGGIETWLMDCLRRADRGSVQMDFLAAGGAGVYDEEARALGAKVHYAPGPKDIVGFLSAYAAVLRGKERYDVIHSHLYSFSGLVLMLAWLFGHKKRIAHSHNDKRSAIAAKGPFKRAYFFLTALLLRRVATKGYACSSPAAEALFGSSWNQDPRWQVLYYGIDTSRFFPANRKKRARSEGIRMLHVGRFVPQKNHAFLLRVLKAVLEKGEKARLACVGDGPLHPAMVSLAQELGISANVDFLGVRGDIPELLSQADIFLFPSLFEGYGLAYVEAQACGCQCIVSDRVSAEADVIPGLIARLSLEAGPEAWADQVSSVFDAGLEVPSGGPLALKGIDVKNSLDKLVAEYLAP